MTLRSTATQRQLAVAPLTDPAHVGSWAGPLAVGDLPIGDKGDVTLLRADVGRPAWGAERLLALGDEGGAGGRELLPLGRDRPGPTLGIIALPCAFSQWLLRSVVTRRPRTAR